MEIEGYIYYQACGSYDENGHTDDYDLIFCRCDTGEELCLNGFEDAIFPTYKRNFDKAWINPISVHDKVRGKLTIKFEKEVEL